MSGSSFVHLHNHTEYSMLDGMAQVDLLAQEVKRLGMPAVGMTDHGNMFGADAFYHAMVKAEIKPIIGIEAYMAPASRFTKTPVTWGEPSQVKDDVAARGRYLHQTMLAENAQGLRNLFTLSSLASYEGQVSKYPRMDQDLVAEYATGIIGTTGCPSGDVQTRLRLGQYDAALEAAATWQDIYGKDNYFLELMDHGLEIERRVREDLIRIGKALELPPLVTNDCHYVLQSQAAAHEMMLCVQTGSTLDEKTIDEGGRRFAFTGTSYYIRTAEDIRAQWDAEVPQGCDNTLLIAERVQDYSEVWEPHEFDRMPIADVPEGETPTSWLRSEVMTGLQERFPGREVPQEYIDRANYEIDVIDGKGYPSYFLIVAELIKHAREIGIAVGPGRGSAAGSLVAYALTITNIDPIEHGLLFERFLNPERPSAPDIDIDFEDRGRGVMLEYATQRWGEDKVAQVITFGTVKTKQAIKDAARAHFGQAGFAMADRISKALPPAVAAKDIPLADITDPSAKRYAEAAEIRELIDTDPDVRKIYESARGLEGVIRQPGVHACAVIMSSEPLMDCIPMWKRHSDGAIITGWPYPACENIGLLKMDFLGLRNLTVIGDCLENIRRNRKEDIDLQSLEPVDDAAYALLSRGETLGTFQLDSTGMQELLKRMQPTCFDDIVAALALYRPGPMGVKAHLSYADRKNGREPVTPIHPAIAEDLEEILSETYGLIVYQEQIMKIAQKLAGYTAGQADGFRKAMGKKKPEVLAAEFETFNAGMLAHGHPKEAIKALWDIIVPFAGYAFNKSHAAGYGLVSFWTAYLKANYTAEYMAALLSSVADKKDKLALYLADCRRLGVKVLQPDVNESDTTFHPVGEDIRFGLGAVRNVSSDAVATIIESRQEKGPYKDFSDFLHKVEAPAASKRIVRCLICAGAFDSLGHPRRGLELIHEDAVDAVIPSKKAASRGQYDLFASLAEDGDLGEDDPFRVEIPDMEWKREEQLANEREMLGLYVSDHPLNGYESTIEQESDALITDIVSGQEANASEYIVGGIITSVERRVNKSGATWVIVTLEDHHGGQMDILVFAKKYQLLSQLIAADNIVAARVRVRREDERTSYMCDDMKPLALNDGGGAGRPVNLYARVDQLSHDKLTRFIEVLHRNPGDSDVILTVSDGEEQQRFRFPSTCRVTDGRDLRSELGSETWPGITG